MPINPQIPLSGLLINRNDELLKQQRLRQGQMQMDQYREEGERRQRLADLLPGAAKGDQASIDQLYSVDPEVAMRMDARQREQAKAFTQDLGAAVRWADSPEKWQYVQQHYGQKGVDLSPYRFEDRERGLVALGQMNEYLSGAPKAEYRSIEAGGSLIDVSGGKPRVVIAPNPGGQQTGAPVQMGGNEVTATGPNGQKLRLNPQTNQWEPMGGPTPQASGGFPY